MIETMLSAPGRDPPTPVQPRQMKRRLYVVLAFAFVFFVAGVVEDRRAETFGRSAVETLGTITEQRRYCRSPSYGTGQSLFHRCASEPHGMYWRLVRKFTVTFQSSDGAWHTYGASPKLFGNYPNAQGMRVPVWYVPGDPSNYSVIERSAPSNAYIYNVLGFLAVLFALRAWFEYLTVRPRVPREVMDRWIDPHLLSP